MKVKSERIFLYTKRKEKTLIMESLSFSLAPCVGTSFSLFGLSSSWESSEINRPSLSFIPKVVRSDSSCQLIVIVSC